MIVAAASIKPPVHGAIQLSARLLPWDGEP